MRDHSGHIELSRDEAVRQMLELLPNNFGCECEDQVSIYESYGRVLAEDVAYKCDIPNCLTCSMDSVAVHWDDFEGLEEGETPSTANWVRGKDWEFANTGVAMPEGFDTAIVIENVEVSDDEEHIEIVSSPSKRFAGTRAIGSQASSGDIALKGGQIITSDIAARIAGAGHSSVLVKSKPKVSFIPTGNELVSPNSPYSSSAPEKFAGKGKVFESNSAVVKGKIEAWGGTYVPFDIVADEKEAIAEAIKKACKVSDIVVLNAGSSKGSDDWSVEVLEEMGQIVCHQTNHGPGHHSSYALVDGTPVVGISGPSGGASFTLNFYLLPLMKRFLGLDPKPATIPATLADDFPAGHMAKMAAMAAKGSKNLPGESRPPEATEPGAVFYSIKFLELSANDQGALIATPVPGRPGSAETEKANAYYMCPAGPGAKAPEKGDVIFVELRDMRL